MTPAAGVADDKVSAVSIDVTFLLSVRAGTGPAVGVMFMKTTAGPALLTGTTDGSLARFALPSGTLVLASRLHDYNGKYFVYNERGEFDSSPGMDNFTIIRQGKTVRFLSDAPGLHKPELFAGALKQ